MTTAPGRLTIEVTPEKHRSHGPYRLVHTISEDEWVVVAYAGGRNYLGVLQDFLESRRAMNPELREAEARTLLKVLGVDVETT